MTKGYASIQDITITTSCHIQSLHNCPQDRRVVVTGLPGAGELITGPTVLGEVIAAGNLICASPPYLNTTEDQPLACVKRNLCVF